MKNIFLPLLILAFPILSCSQQETRIIVGAEQMNRYLPLLKEKRVGILANHSAVINNTHMVDTLLSLGINVKFIFSPEHGFRGDNFYGDEDPKTGIPIVTIYGGEKVAPPDSILNQLDVVVYDIQDVGLRFYTYLAAMYHMMEACARNNVPLIILDRPNPNGHYVDGPIVDLENHYNRYVGCIPIPVVHGMTLGEMAEMINGQKWLNNGVQCNVTVITCLNYTHQSLYELPIKPSPNLPNNRSIYLYPSLCLFEGTPISIGRRSDYPFQVYGHPDFTNRDFTFIVTPNTNTNNPEQSRGPVTYYGVDLRTYPPNETVFEEGFTLKYVIDAYNDLNNSSNVGEAFFRPYFDTLVGVSYARTMILEGYDADQIKACWKDDVEQFKKDRAPYLLYPLE